MVNCEGKSGAKAQFTFKDKNIKILQRVSYILVPLLSRKHSNKNMFQKKYTNIKELRVLCKIAWCFIFLFNTLFKLSKDI